MNLKPRKKISSFQIILLGFLGLILFGALLLMLPISSKSREFTPFMDSLFTSTSAVCVTGLCLVDTASHWSIFGQVIIMLLIQIGGMGVVTIAMSLALLSGRKIGLFARGTMQEQLTAPQVGGIAKLTFFVIKWTLIIELIGALIMLPVFVIDHGAIGIFMAIFHSISAFCNAGFDIMGTNGEASSLMSYAANPVINITIMLLIIIGGIGFLTWDDICKHKWHLSKYKMQSKIIFIVTTVLIFVPAIYFFFFEFSDLPFGERLLTSLFQSVTTRTAGFYSVDIASITDHGLVLMIILMLIGGAPGSTAGGIKVTTIAVLFTTCLSTFRKKEDVEMLKRRVDHSVIKQAIAILILYITLFVVSGIVISAIEGIPIINCLYETVSAIGTVGLTTGITPSLTAVSKIILMILMFIGRVGGLTLIYAAIGSGKKQVSKLPIERITVG